MSGTKKIVKAVSENDLISRDGRLNKLNKNGKDMVSEVKFKNEMIKKYLEVVVLDPFCQRNFYLRIGKEKLLRS